MMAVMLYAIRCLSENDQHALRNMNFGPEVAALRELNLADLYRAGGLQAHCLDIQLNRDVTGRCLRTCVANARAKSCNATSSRPMPRSNDAACSVLAHGVYEGLRCMLAVEPARSVARQS